MYRVTTARLLGVVAVLAVGLAAVRSASEQSLSLSVSATQVVLLFSVLGAAVRPAPAAAWRGFAIFGCCYFFFTLSSMRPESPQSSWPTQRNIAIGSHWPSDHIVIFIVGCLYPDPIPPKRPSLAREGDPIYDSKHDLAWPVPKSQSNPEGTLPLSQVDAAAWKEYQVNTLFVPQNNQAHESVVSKANAIYHAYLSLLFGFVGAIAGPIMARKRDRPRLSQPSADLQTENNLEPSGTHG
jgi:hypothetical protein